MFLLLKELLQPDGLPARTHPLGRGVFNETPSHHVIQFNHELSIMEGTVGLRKSFRTDLFRLSAALLTYYLPLITSLACEIT